MLLLASSLLQKLSLHVNETYFPPLCTTELSLAKNCFLFTKSTLFACGTTTITVLPHSESQWWMLFYLKAMPAYIIKWSWLNNKRMALICWDPKWRILSCLWNLSNCVCFVNVLHMMNNCANSMQMDWLFLKVLCK